VTVFSPAEREPHTLTIQHIPFATTFALFESGHLLALDPTLGEEAAATGAVTVVSNAHDELCGVHKAKGTGVSAGQLMRCVRLGNRRAQALGASLRAALDVHKLARVQSRIKRWAGAAPSAPAADAAAAAAAAAPRASAVATLSVGGVVEALPAMAELAVAEPASPAAEPEAGPASERDADSAMTAPEEPAAEEPAAATPEAPRARLAAQESGAKKKKRRESGGEDVRGPKRPGIPATPVDKEPGFDRFGAIAAMIAGASSNGGVAASLKDSVKPHKKKK